MTLRLILSIKCISLQISKHIKTNLTKVWQRLFLRETVSLMITMEVKMKREIFQIHQKIE